MHGQFSNEFYSTPSIPANPDRRRWYLQMLEPLEYSKNIPDGVVWDVVCRWHGMRLFFDLYCDKAVTEDYVISKFPYTSGPIIPDTTEASAQEEDIPKPSQFPRACANEMSPVDRKSSYERFYKALTAQWVAIDQLWKVRSQVWSNGPAFDQAFETTMNGWTHNPGRPLQENLDIVEIVDFIWGFLGRNVFHISRMPSWLEGEGDRVRDYYIEQNESEAANWGFFVRSVIQFLRPPQIIQLVLSSWYPSGWNYDRSGFLRHLGLFDAWEGILVDRQDYPMSDSWVTLDTVDANVGSSYAHMDNAKEIEARWQSYRDVQWSTEMRGNLFFRNTAEREVLYKLTGAGE